jgi:hypothetical protein
LITRFGRRWNLGGGGGILIGTTDVTRILSQIESEDPQAANQLLPLVYDELRDPYELTKLGEQFVHYTMNEMVPKIQEAEPDKPKPK